MKEAGEALAAAGTTVTTAAGDAVKEAQVALESVAAAVEPSPAQLSAAQDKVAEAEAAVAKVAASADAGAKEELSRVESSLTAAKNIVSEAIAKAEAEAAEVV